MVKKDNELVKIEEMISLLRLQKHDFLNHLQVVAGFLQLNKHALAQEYLIEAITQIQQGGEALRIQSPELVGVLYRYKAKGEQLGMAIDIKVANEMLELGEKGKIFARLLKDLFEILFLEATPFGVNLEIIFVQGEEGNKICKIVLTFPETGQDNYKKMEKIEAFVDEAGIAYYNQIENQWIIEFIIE